MHVLVVHNRYASAQPSGENKVVDQEVGCCAGRPPGRGVRAAQRRHRRPVPARQGRDAAAGAVEPGGPHGTRRQAARRAAGRGARPQRLPAPVARGAGGLRRRRRARRRHAAQLHPGLPARHAAAGRRAVHRVRGVGAPLPAVRHGCYRNSRLATVPLAVSLSVNRRRWWSGVERFFCISAAQRDVLVRSGMPAERLAVKHNFVPDPGARRAGAGEHLLFLGRLAEAKGVRLLMAAWDEIAADGGVGVPLGDRRRGAAGAGGDRLGGGPGRRAVRRPVRPGPVPAGRRAVGRRGGSLDVAWRRSAWWSWRRWRRGSRPSPPVTAPSSNSSRTG